VIVNRVCVFFKYHFVLIPKRGDASGVVILEVGQGEMGSEGGAGGGAAGGRTVGGAGGGGRWREGGAVGREGQGEGLVQAASAAHTSTNKNT
jgi:hypothetical protein